jgi:hypothetical protein
VAPEVTSVNTSANPNLIIFVSDDSPLTGDNIVKKGQAENVKLSDQYPYYIPFPFKANHISYTRTPERYYDVEGNKGLTTLVLPFAATSCHATIDGVVKPLNWYTNSTDGPYYNLNGQRVSRPSKGIYIDNGKKVIFK